MVIPYNAKQPPSFPLVNPAHAAYQQHIQLINSKKIHAGSKTMFQYAPITEIHSIVTPMVNY